MSTIRGTSLPERRTTESLSDPPADLRAAMRLFPTGVALLSTGHGKQAIATTINAVMSVSLSPPQLLISVLRTSRAQPVLEATGTFSINLLTAEQADLARLFATSAKPVGAALAAHLQPRTVDGHTCHVLPGSLATMSCTVRTSYPGGDHDLFLGHVDHVLPGAAEHAPLVFHHGRLVGGTHDRSAGTHTDR
ncbi:flavin reductase family protein [Streptomyces sp. NPDC059479]|uniref:flavin reductase family protein n=1 Tax=Streptomyces sp. NPDC059479 TaxID=3346848 RepID=UPI003683E440